MAKHHITSEDVANYYASIFGERRQFEGMRIDSGNKERLIIIDMQHDFMPDCDYYKMSLKNMIEIHRPEEFQMNIGRKLTSRIRTDIPTFLNISLQRDAV